MLPVRQYVGIRAPAGLDTQTNCLSSAGWAAASTRNSGRFSNANSSRRKTGTQSFAPLVSAQAPW
jgi:hypothetical protein